MSVIIKTKPPVVPVVEPISEIVVNNELPHGRGSSTEWGNKLVVAVGTSARRTEVGQYRLETPNIPTAHLNMIQGSGLYLSPLSLRALGQSLIEAADQLEDDR